MHLSRRHYYGLGLLLLVIIGVAVTTYFVRTQAVREAADVANEALFSPEATAAFTDLEGKPINVSEARDGVVIATTWASWCPQCATELQLLNDLVGQYPPDSVRVLALNRMEPSHQARRFLAPMPTLTNITFVLDNQDHFFAAIEGYAMPETIVYNQAGEIVLHKRGNLAPSEVEEALSTAGLVR